MRAHFHLRIIALFLLCWSSALAVHATHILGGDLTYKYAGTTANPNQYHITARLFRVLSAVVDDPQIILNCGMNECGSALPGSFTTTLSRTTRLSVPSNCTGSGSISYEVTNLEGMVQLPPAYWTLSISLGNRARDLVNIAQSDMVSFYVKAELDNTTGLTNSSPQFTTARLIELSNTQAQQHYSLSAFDSEGDSLVYQLVQPLATPTTASPCGILTVGPVAPHFQLDAATGQLATVAGPAQQGRYVLDARVDEYRRIGSTWQQIGSIMRDMTYFVVLSANQLPGFIRVASAGNPAGQLLGQTIRVNPGQTLSLTLTAADPDAGQQLTMTSDLAAIVPGATFQDLGNGQGRLTWQVPAAQPLGRYALTATATDNACPVPGADVLTLPVLVTQQALATHQARQPMAQLPFPMPFHDEVQFQLAGQGRQWVVITDGLGRTVARLLSTAEGRIVWRPSAGVAAGLYLARNQDGTQVAQLSHAGH